MALNQGCKSATPEQLFQNKNVQIFPIQGLRFSNNKNNNMYVLILT